LRGRAGSAPTLLQWSHRQMSTYAHSDFELIATAIGAALESVANLESKFEAAAFWFRVDKRQPTRTPPSKRHEKLTQVAKSARRLLKSLGINDPDEAPDGPGDPDIFKALVLTGEPEENPVVEATRARSEATPLKGAAGCRAGNEIVYTGRAGFISERSLVALGCRSLQASDLRS